MNYLQNIEVSLETLAFDYRIEFILQNFILSYFMYIQSNSMQIVVQKFYENTERILFKIFDKRLKIKFQKS